MSAWKRRKRYIKTRKRDQANLNFVVDECRINRHDWPRHPGEPWRSPTAPGTYTCARCGTELTIYADLTRHYLYPRQETDPQQPARNPCDT